MIRQRISLDRLRALSYIGAVVGAAACVPRPEPLIPAPLPAVDRDSAAAWAGATLPRRPTAIRFRWKYRDDRLSAAGRGQARIAPPDSLRLDYVATLGVKSGAGVVIGDSVLWADPDKDFRSLVPAIPMLWAALGFVPLPATSAACFGELQHGGDDATRLLRVAQASDTLEYLLARPAHGAAAELRAQWRQGGRVIATSWTRFALPSGQPASARIDFPEGPARFELTVVAVDTVAEIPPALWRSRR